MNSLLLIVFCSSSIKCESCETLKEAWHVSVFQCLDFFFASYKNSSQAKFAYPIGRFFLLNTSKIFSYFRIFGLFQVGLFLQGRIWETQSRYFSSLLLHLKKLADLFQLFSLQSRHQTTKATVHEASRQPRALKLSCYSQSRRFPRAFTLRPSDRESVYNNRPPHLSSPSSIIW